MNNAVEITNIEAGYKLKLDQRDNAISELTKERDILRLDKRDEYERAERLREELKAIKKEKADRVPRFTVDKEFKGLLPPLDAETYSALEAELIRDGGCRDPLVIWNGLLIDGHNRHEICRRHGLIYDVVVKEFGCRNAVMAWIIATQIARRNLTSDLMGYYRGKQYELEKAVVTNPDGANQHKKEVGGQNVHQAKTAQKIAEQHNVNEKTIRRDGKMANAIDKIGDISPEAKQKILSGASGVGKGEIIQLASASQETLEEVAEDIINGTFEAIKSLPKKVVTERLKVCTACGEEKTLNEFRDGEFKCKKCDSARKRGKEIQSVKSLQYRIVVDRVQKIQLSVEKMIGDVRESLVGITDKEEKDDIRVRVQEVIRELGELL